MVAFEAAAGETVCGDPDETGPISWTASTTHRGSRQEQSLMRAAGATAAPSGGPGRGPCDEGERLRRIAYFGMGVLLIASSIYLSRDLIQQRDLLLLAALGPVILAAAAFGLMLLVRVFRT
jgi:hypothetical protein